MPKTKNLEGSQTKSNENFLDLIPPRVKMYLIELEEAGNKALQISVYNEYANYYYSINNYKISFEFFKKAFNLAKEIDPSPAALLSLMDSVANEPFHHSIGNMVYASLNLHDAAQSLDYCMEYRSILTLSDDSKYHQVLTSLETQIKQLQDELGNSSHGSIDHSTDTFVGFCQIIYDSPALNENFAQELLRLKNKDSFDLQISLAIMMEALSDFFSSTMKISSFFPAGSPDYFSPGGNGGGSFYGENGSTHDIRKFDFSHLLLGKTNFSYSPDEDQPDGKS